MKKTKILLKGEIIKILPNLMYKIKLENSHICLGYASGKIKLNKIKIFEGDFVEIEFGGYDFDKGRISKRF